MNKGDVIRLHSSAWKVEQVIGHFAFCGPLKWYSPDLREVAPGTWVTKHGGYDSSVLLATALKNGKGTPSNWKGEPDESKMSPMRVSAAKG